MIWKSCLFSGNKIFENSYCLSVQFSSNHNNDSWVLSNIYAPCTAPGKREFLQWFKNIQMPHTMNWLLVGDLIYIEALKIGTNLGVTILKCTCSMKPLVLLVWLSYL